MRDLQTVDSARDHALAIVERFGQKLLPGVMRRIGAWKGISPQQLADLQEDVLQELRIDCLRHPEALDGMDARARHARWMQLSERTVYRLRRDQRRCSPLVEEPSDRAQRDQPLPLQLPPLVTLNNGRANVAESARAAGLGRRAMRERLDELAAQLGWSEERRRFWRNRAAEALTDLAADHLRATGSNGFQGERQQPDLDARRARLRRIARMIPVQPATLEERRALQPWVRRPQPDPPARELLRRATALAPDRAAGWLWMFEALIATLDLRRASRALRRASGCRDVRRSDLILARARLLAARGQPGRAAHMMTRARTRRDPDQRLRRAVEAVRA
mgnify:CR=1 FL=1